MMDNKNCKCGKPSTHEMWSAKTGNVYQCCECHIKSGGAPADWHSGCMVAYKKLKEVEE